jgi:hypothetical protein
MTYAFTNFSSFRDTNNAESTSVHGIGSVWATMLWDLTWLILQSMVIVIIIYTGNGGNNKVIQLVIDGFKINAMWSKQRFLIQ